MAPKLAQGAIIYFPNGSKLSEALYEIVIPTSSKAESISVRISRAAKLRPSSHLKQVSLFSIF